MKKRTRIVATLGPVTEDKKQIKALVEAGMNIARLNFSHGSYEQYLKITKNIRAAEKATGKIVSIMQDLQGPKIRIGKLPHGHIDVKRGEELTFSPNTSDQNCIHIPYRALSKVVKVGERLLIEDGMIRTKVTKVNGNKVTVKVQVGGVIKDCKGVNIPDSTMPASATLTSKDKKDLAYGVNKLKVDAIAISFVETAQDIHNVRKEIRKHTKREILIIAKIERKDALKNLEAIIEATDGVMVARGDLGIETKAERVPIIQKRIVRLARTAGKPVIIATQMLQSMVKNPLATRAEVSDAANAVFDLADAFMLSNETAVGAFPIQAVKTLATVAYETEAAMAQHQELYPVPVEDSNGLIEDESIALNACYLSDDVDAKALIIMTKKGHTAQTVIKHRPMAPIVIVTNDASMARKINFMWGANDIVLIKGNLSSEDIKKQLKKKKIIKGPGDVVIVKLSNKKRSLVVMSV
ncbi:MAG: pyruvate kinase [Oceanicoccus sp.]